MITEVGLLVHAAATPGYLCAVRSVLFDAVTEPQAAALADILDSLVTHLTPGARHGGTGSQGDAPAQRSAARAVD